MPTNSPSPSIRLVVFDLDNTLYDWVTYFAESFYRMVAIAAPLLSVSEERLLDDLKLVHQRHHNSEHPFALLETDCARERFPGLSRAELGEQLDVAFHEFNRARNNSLSLYEGVIETLVRLRDNGTKLVAHTEATVPNAQFRLRKLGIESYFLKLYASTPSGDGHFDERKKAEQPDVSLPVRYLERDERKPDPRVLLDICNDMRTSVAQTLYVGDSITRDIGMANSAGVHSAWAKYGTLFDKGAWARLVRVTHWTAEDVARAEAAAHEHRSARPDIVLERSLTELFERFNFQD